MKKNLKCNKPVKSWRKGKKYAVKACTKDKEKVLHFGVKGYEDYLTHKDEKRRKNFKTRHKCKESKDKLTPKWWSCNWSW